MPAEAPILIVDDFIDGLEMYGEFLTFHGYRVVLAKSGSEAIEHSRAEPPALILMDLEMPDMNGTQTLSVLRADPALASTPIVAFTAHAFSRERDQALRDGFDDVIAKPCLPDDLLARIELLVRAARES